MTPRRRTLLIAGALLLSAASAAPVFASREATVGTTRESWYLVTPLPAQPPVEGLPEAPTTPPDVSPYPAGTLHAGITAGQEDSRTYLALDLAGVAGEEIVGGTLTLPVAADGGTRSPELAQLRVCRADSAGDGARGSTAPPPAVECTIGSPARYVADRNAFEVDLSPLVGFLDRGLAVIPSAAAAESTWHVAFHAADSEVADAPSIQALVVTEDDVEVAAPTVTASPPVIESTTFASTVHPESAVSVAAPDVGIGQTSGSARPAPLAPATGTTPSPRTAPIGVTGTDGFRYSVVFALPLLVLVGVPYFGYALTGPVTDQRRRDNRALKSS